MADEAQDAPQMSIGNMIQQKVMENINKMDLPAILQKIVASSPEDEESQAARDKIQAVLEKFKTMNEEEREAFTEQIKSGLVSKLSARLQDRLGDLDENIQQAVLYKLATVGFGVLLLVVLLVFFGYKLYKSIKEKEIKREEKKKAKQMKKKK